MRAAAAIAAGILALAACKVDVDGAPCRSPGDATDCPSGQACGNDGKCSARAATCARCTPGQSLCPGGDGTALARRCTGADPVCGSWVEEDCGARGLVCGSGAGGGEVGCICPSGSEGPVFAADPVEGSLPGEPPFATGAESPPACRFRRLGDAIAAAGAFAASGPATVQAYAAASPVIFGDAATGEGPIRIPANVTVAGAAQAVTILRFEGATSTPLVTLGGALEGFEIEGVSATGAGVAISCAPEGRPSLTRVAVDGGDALATGVDVSGACGADLTDVTVAKVDGPALRVHADPSAQVTVLGGALRTSEVGAYVTDGKVTFGSDGDPTRSVEVSGNAHEGVVLSTGAPTDARLYGARIHGNAGTGVVVEPVAGSGVSLLGCDVLSNGDGAPRSYGPGGGRSVGGVLVAQNGISLAFWGNRVYANRGDQLAFESSAAWSIAPSACGPSSNLFACVASGAYAVAVAGGGTVDASNTVWPAVPFASYMSPRVTAPPTSYCNTMEGVPATPACPTP